MTLATTTSITDKGKPPTTFTIASPEKEPSMSNDDNDNDGVVEDDTDVDDADMGAEDVDEDDNGANKKENLDLYKEDNDEEKLESSSDLSFKKKDVRKSRTQSFQSVLSTASIKSLKQQVASSNSIQPSNRNDSIISNNNTSMMNGSNSKNFQSFIQAPVLSSISNLKKGDDVEIGQQLPFNDTKKSRSPSPDIQEDTSNEYEDDTMMQQQKLTLNALKKLSLSPMPIINADEKRPVSRKNSVKNPEKSEPYQPAEVDLSAFASLTRQPKFVDMEEHAEKPVQRKQSLPRLPEDETLSQAQQKYHNDIKQHQTSQKHNKVPPAVTPSQDMNTRRISNPPPAQPYHSHTPMAPQPQHYPHQPARKSSKQLQQIKGLRSPMYVPAVLRKTFNGMSPTSSQTSSNGTSQPGSPNETPIMPNVPHDHLNPFRLSPDNDNESSRASIKSTDSGMSMESTSSTKNSISTTFLGSKKYSDVLKSAPTRKHWLKDETVLECGISSCGKQFNFFERRHHCRKCGRIYCKEHTSHYLYINHLAQFTTGGRGTLSKVCDLCIAEYNDFIQHEFGVNIAQCQKVVPEPAKTLQTPPKEVNKTGMTFIKNKESPNRSDQLVGSIPANWSWSSF